MTQPVVSLGVNRISTKETDTGLLFSAALSYDEWAAVTAKLQRDHKAFLWKLGDAIVWGRDHFGERYSQAVDTYSINSIERAVAVCQAFPYPRRRACGFAHHQAVLARRDRSRGSPYLLTSEEQDALLERVEREDWTREALREEIAAIRRQKAPPANDTPPEPAPNTNNASPTFDQSLSAEALREPVTAGTGSAAISPALSPDGLAARAEAAAAILTEVADRGACPEDFAAAIRVVLMERELLLRLARAAKAFLSTATLDGELPELPLLTDALHEWTGQAPEFGRLTPRPTDAHNRML